MGRIQNDIENVGINKIPMRFKLNNNGEPKREFETAINAVVQFTKRLSAS